jgi:hypothetical protein
VGVALGCELPLLLICAAVTSWLGHRAAKRFPVRS